MKTRFALLAVLLVAGSAGASSILDSILAYRSLGQVEIAPAGARAVFVATAADLEENVLDSNVWVADWERGEHYPLTRSPRRDWQPRWSPDGATVAFLTDREGKTEIWSIALRGGEASRLVPTEGEVTGFRFLPDGTGVVLTMRDPETEEQRRRREEEEDWIEVDRDFRMARLYRFRFRDQMPELLTSAEEHVNGFDVAPSGAARPWVVFSSQPTPKVPDERLRSDLKLLDLETGAVRDLVRREGLDLDPAFSPDGRLVAFVSMDGKADWIGNYYVCLVAPEGGEPENVSRSIDERVEAPLRWSRDGKRLYLLAGRGPDRRLFEIDREAKTSRTLLSFDQGKSVSSFDRSDSGELLLAASDPHTPAEIYRLSESGEARRETSVNAGYPAGNAGKTEILSYRSRDGLEVSGLLIRPPGFQEGGRPSPLLVVIHGGPSGVFDTGFAPRRGVYPIHAFLAEGYLLFLPNPRGSGGFGDSFRRSNFRDWGFGDFEDILAGVDLLVERGLADPDRMGVMGWSYGGFMTSWTVTHTDRFRAASIGAPVTNPYSFYGVTDIPEFIEAYFGGKPWDDGVDYLRHAPEHFAQNAKTPSLIQHGAADRRVPLSQGESFYRALRASGVEAEMVIYPRQPHGLEEPRFIRDAMERNLHWFERYLMGSP